MPKARPTDPCSTVLRALPDDVRADLRLVDAAWTTIRFAGGRIHQPATEATRSLSLRVEDRRQLGVATTTDLSTAGIERLVASARALARAAPREPKFPGFGAGGRAAPPVPFSSSTAATSPEAACLAARAAIDAALHRRPEAIVTGALHVGTETLRVVTTEGVDRSTRGSAAQLTVLAEGPDRETPTSGWSEGAHWDLARLAPERIGAEAADRMPRETPQAVAPGRYPVVLLGPAVAEMLGFLAYLGFGGVAEVDGASCLGRLRGRRPFPRELTIRDDPRSPETLPVGIDFEGTVTRPLRLVDRGVVGPAVTDTIVGGRLGRASTGHAGPPESPWGEIGPLPGHLLLDRGNREQEELCGEVGDGLLVTRFHYVRTVDPARGTITGMTRDGTYRIRDGAVAEPVRNLRFTESVVDALKGTVGIGRERRIYAGERGSGCATVPALACRSFAFTSATAF